MRRITICLATALLVAGGIQTASAQGAAPAAPAAKKLTREKLKEMRAQWKANKPKLAACRKEVKQKGLAGDDRWFYMSDCMSKP
jgi:hypothetical protein